MLKFPTSNNFQSKTVEALDNLQLSEISSGYFRVDHLESMFIYDAADIHQKTCSACVFYYTTIVQCQLNLCLFCVASFHGTQARTWTWTCAVQILPIIIGLLSFEHIYKIVYVSRRINYRVEIGESISISCWLIALKSCFCFDNYQ